MDDNSAPVLAQAVPLKSWAPEKPSAPPLVQARQIHVGNDDDAPNRPRFDQMTLVKRGSPNQAVFENVSQLISGSPTKLTLRSHPGMGIGMQYVQERQFGEWRYIESCGTQQAQAIEVSWVEQNFLKVSGRELVFDVAFWKMNSGTPVNFVGGHNKDRTNILGPGRNFTVNRDGTISCSSYPNLVLGFTTIGHWEGQGRKITTEEIAGCWCCVCLPAGCACFRKEPDTDDDDAMWHKGCLILPFVTYFSEKRIRIPNTNGWGKDGEMHNIDDYPCGPCLVCNGPSCSMKLCCFNC